MRRRTTRWRITTRMDADIDYCGDEVMMMRRRRKKKKNTRMTTGTDEDEDENKENY